jgi:hypothetical protein
MVDPTANKFLLGCHRSGVTIPVRYCISGMGLVGVGAQLGTSTSVSVVFHHSYNTSHLQGSVPASGWFVVSTQSGFLV